MRNLSKARGRILELLSQSETPCTVNSLAIQTGQHENTIREHLDALVDENLAIRYQSPEHLRGRPAWLYRILDDADQSHDKEYAGLASALAGQIARSSKHPRKDAIEAGQSWAPTLVQNSRLKPDLDGKATMKKNATISRSSVVTLLDQLGFAPTHNADLTKVKLTRCPLLDAARQYPDIICEVHLGIIRGTLDECGADTIQIEKTILEPFSQPGACLLWM